MDQRTPLLHIMLNPCQHPLSAKGMCYTITTTLTACACMGVLNTLSEYVRRIEVGEKELCPKNDPQCHSHIPSLCIRLLFDDA